MTLVLSLFPGIGLLDMAFEEQGFCVVRGPDLLWGGDIKRFHPPEDRFDGVIGGPPCQAFCSMRHLIAHLHRKDPTKYKPAENLIPEFERCVYEAQPRWFLMENVPDAPEPSILEYDVHSVLVNNRWVGGTQNRVRRFSFGSRDGIRLEIPGEALEPAEYTSAVLASGTIWSKERGRPEAQRTQRYFDTAVVAQGLPEGWDLPGFTVAGKIKALGNGVPLPLGRAVARAVMEKTAKQGEAMKKDRTWDYHHSLASEASIAASIAHRDGDLQQAERLYYEAATEEVKALACLPAEKLRTIRITAESVVALCCKGLDCRERLGGK